MNKLVLQVISDFEYQITKTNKLLEKHGYKINVNFELEEVY